MRRTLFLWIAVFGMALSAADALDLQAITAKPAAHSPRFDDKEAWPDLVGDECFLKQEWPKARLLIWPHGNEDFGRGDPRPDPTDPTSWIDAATGKPAGASPDMETDILLPDADKPYNVSLRGQMNRSCRHVTVGRNATFEPGGGAADTREAVHIDVSADYAPTPSFHLRRYSLGVSPFRLRKKALKRGGSLKPVMPDTAVIDRSVALRSSSARANLTRLISSPGEWPTVSW